MPAPTANTMVSTLSAENGLDRKRPIFSMLDTSEVEEVFADLVPPVSIHIECSNMAHIRSTT